MLKVDNIVPLWRVVIPNMFVYSLCTNSMDVEREWLHALFSLVSFFKWMPKK